MPVKKRQECCSDETAGCGCGSVCGHCSTFVKKIFATLLGVLLVYVIIFFGTLIRNNLEKYQYIGQVDKMERTIVVEAQGKATAIPDVAVTTLGMSSKAATVAEAQKNNTEVMNKLVGELRALNVADDDIQTLNYNIYPNYRYTPEGEQILEGYEVNQQLQVKVRELAKANEVIALAGKLGLNQVNGIQFTIDDNEVYKAQAREEALQKIAQKATNLSQALGVRLVEIVSYNEYEAGDSWSMYKGYSDVYMAEGMGGGTPAPDIQPGSQEVKLNVSVQFAIR
ncbi:MAG TPA: SIMPL domain-containing protein [Patescibacteria group bacterium]|nr:SIMPL domain-containing protein [Patescibacteria group bacterium]